MEPDENITDEEIYVVFNSVVVIVPATFKVCRVVVPSTFKLPAICAEPLTPKYFSVTIPSFTSNPLFGEIVASAEPDFNLLISPIDAADMFVMFEPSPAKNEADIVPVVNTEPVISVLTFIESLSFDILATPAPP